MKKLKQVIYNCHAILIKNNLNFVKRRKSKIIKVFQKKFKKKQKTSNFQVVMIKYSKLIFYEKSKIILNFREKRKHEKIKF